MPFRSKRQMRFMYAKHPKIAKRWSTEQKRKHQPLVVKARKGRRR